MSRTTGVRDAHSRRREAVRWGLALLLAALAAWLSIRQVRWIVLKDTLTHARVPLLALALATVLATTGAKAARWRVLLRTCNAQVSGIRVLRALLIGQMGNILLPARLGDAARAILIGPRAEGGIPAVLGTIVVEKALDGVMGLVILLSLALWTPLPAWLRGPILALVILTGGLLVLLALAATQRQRVARVYQWSLRPLPPSARTWVLRVTSGFGLGLGLFRYPDRFATALAWTAAIWGMAALTNVVTMAALNIEAPGWSTWLVLVTGYGANFLPTVPAQIGVFEYACVLALSAVGVNAALALAFGMVLHLLVYIPPLVLGPISMATEGLTWTRLKETKHENLERGDVPS